jgi:hypothetical protein
MNNKERMDDVMDLFRDNRIPRRSAAVMINGLPATVPEFRQGCYPISSLEESLSHSDRDDAIPDGGFAPTLGEIPRPTVS